MDIALDPFPYNGMVTTMEALWMGVPVVAMEGRMHAGRGALSILSALGLHDLVAPDPDGYVRLAASLAADRGRIGALRSTLRQRMLASPLCDGPGYARRMEALLRSLWRAFCGG